MRKSYGSHMCVCVSVCVSVTTLAATYLVYKSQVMCYKDPYGVSNVCIVWILLKRSVLQFWHHLLLATAFTTSFQYTG